MQPLERLNVIPLFPAERAALPGDHRMTPLFVGLSVA